MWPNRSLQHQGRRSCPRQPGAATQGTNLPVSGEHLLVKKATSAKGSGPLWLALPHRQELTCSFLDAHQLADKGTFTPGYRWDSRMFTRRKFGCGFYPTSQTLTSNPGSAAKCASHGILDTEFQLVFAAQACLRGGQELRALLHGGQTGTPFSGAVGSRARLKQTHQCAQPWKTAVSCTT